MEKDYEDELWSEELEEAEWLEQRQDQRDMDEEGSHDSIWAELD